MAAITQYVVLLTLICVLDTCVSVGVITMATTEYSVHEGTQVDIKLLRQGTAASSINVVVQVADPYAQGGLDFIGTSQTTVFPAGTEDQTITVVFTIQDDDIPEPDETFILSLRVTNGDGMTGNPHQARLTIVANDDSFGIFSFASLSPLRVEESESDRQLTLLISRSRGVFGNVELFYQILTTDLLNNDLGPVTGSIQFYTGEMSKYLTLTVYADQFPELDKIFTVKLTEAVALEGASPASTPPYINTTRSQVSVTIAKNDAPIRFTQREYRVDEAEYDTTISLTITRGLDADGTTILGPTSEPASVSYYLVAMTASPGLDYVGSNGSVAFSPGITRTSVTVQILGDLIPENAETFRLILDSPVGNVVLVAPSECLVIISANDDHQGVLSLKTPSELMFPVIVVNEDEETKTSGFVIQRSGGSYGRVTIEWVLLRNDSSNGGDGDIQPTVGMVTLEDGQSEQPIELEIIQDSEPEPVERYKLQLLAGSVSGGGRAEGVLQGALIIQDSDEAHGIVEFTGPDVQQLITTTSPRKLLLSVVRSGGTVGVLQIQYDVLYMYDGARQSGLLLSSVPGLAIFPAGQDSLSVEVLIRDDAFLQINAVFTVTLMAVTLSDGSTLPPYNTPRLGDHKEALITVTMETANGQVGFSEPLVVKVTEPEGAVSATQVRLELVRVGTNGNVNIIWKATGGGANPGHVTSHDITPLEGTVSMITGQSAATLVLEILPDDEPETEEYVTVEILRIEPQETQRIRPGGATVAIIILENDSPGGVFHFSDGMELTYTVQEELNAIELTIERSGAALVDRQLQYTIEPNGEAEFYGDTNIVSFLAGEVRKVVTVLARGDEIPELTEEFVLQLRSFGEKTSLIGTPSSIDITVLSNDLPYGMFEFTENSTTYVEETKGADLRYARVPVSRQMGRFGQATIDWFLTDDNADADLQPVQGTLTFQPGVGEVTIDLEVIADQFPEDTEMFQINLTSPTGGATLGDYITASVVILQNDDPVFFKEPSRREVSEAGVYDVIIERGGRTDREVSISYHTVDGSATEAGRDYVIINEGHLVFAPGIIQQVVSVTILDDELAEPDETFYLELYDEQGDVAVYGPPAEIVIMSNDLSNGVFHFSASSHKSVQEGLTVQFELSRDVGIYGRADVYCQIYGNDTGELIQEGEDFLSSVVMATFMDLEQTASLFITPLQDGLPEYNEVFQIVLYNVSGGRPDDAGHLAGSNLTVYLTILENDSPYGLFMMSDGTREITISEDVHTGNEDRRIAHLTIERAQGSFTTVQVAWEVFSYQIAGAGNLPLLVDLLLVGTAPPVLQEVPLKRRVGTGTKVLQFDGCESCYVTIPSVYDTPLSYIQDGFSMSAWIQPRPNTDGYILSKASADGARIFYALRIATVTQGNFYSLTLMFLYSTENKPVVSEQQVVNVDVADGRWHFVLVSVDNGYVFFYVDGATRGSRQLEGHMTEDYTREGATSLLVGAIAPGTHRYSGLLQDIRTYNMKLDDNEIRELYETPSSQDLFPISGYTTFLAGELRQDIIITAIDDREEEANDVFSVKLISAMGGSTVSLEQATSTLTVLKSDNANGLFGFSAPCQPAFTDAEDAIFHCPVLRQRGDADMVTVSWEVSETSTGLLATSDFVNASGEIVFGAGERLKMLVVQAIDDNVPEVEEIFDVRLTNALSGDGLVGSTNDSGASIDPATHANNLTIADNDYPYGLLQFSNLPPGDTGWIQPITEQPMLSIPEEVGVVSLTIGRAQGTLGDVSVEWRTVDGTARSSGKSPPDYVAEVNRLTLAEGQLYAHVNITILDNEIPESEKYFWVELVNPRGGAAVGVGSRLQVVIKHSDHAYGVFQIDKESEYIIVQELKDTDFNTVQVKVVREGGTIGRVNVRWSSLNDTDKDLVDGDGFIMFEDGQKDGEITVKIHGDTIPELDEQYAVILINVSKGFLGDAGDIVSHITVPANDDPYGVYVISENSRLVHAQEGEDNFTSVWVTVQRRLNSGTLGEVEVFYRTLDPLELYPHLPGGLLRADWSDYQKLTGSVYFGVGQMSASFNLTIINDELPEMEETLFVILTGAELILKAEDDISGSKLSADTSPRIGELTKTYSQVIIDPNDDPNGIIELSVSEITVTEDTITPLVNVIRRAGRHGELRIRYEVLQGSALYGLDYTVASTDIFLLSDQTEKVVPVEIINDRIPEPDEQFMIRLLSPIEGGATLGDVMECLITIFESDDLHGAFGFESRTLSAEEPGDRDNTMFEIGVVRRGGTEGLVTVKWKASVNGDETMTDFTPTSGSVNFVSNQARQVITIAILPDDLPEGVESVDFELLSASNGGRIISNERSLILNILPNDNPHGTLEFTQESYVIQELENDMLEYVPITRRGGSYGTLRIHYHTTEIDLIQVALQHGSQITDYFSIPQPGLAPLRPDAGTPWNVMNQPEPLQACLRFCLLTEACQTVYYSTQQVQCKWYTFSDVQYLDNRTGYLLYQKHANKTKPLYTMRAKDGIDFSAISEASVIIPDGATEGLLPVLVYADSAPELNESFTITVTSVDLQGEPPVNPRNLPQLGPKVQATVIIGLNDDANGVFTVYSTDPRAQDGGRTVSVEERPQFAVELVVDRQGGSIGTATVTWSVNKQRTTASTQDDYIADGATLTFSPGITRRTLTIAVKDDLIPENDEVIIIELTRPQGGAVLAARHEVTLRILANDHVAGLLSFKQATQLAKEGDLLILTVQRSMPALGSVITRWRIITDSSQPPTERFRIITGSLYFAEGESAKDILLHVLVDNKPKIRQEYRLQLFNVQTSGIGETGAAAVDPNNGEARITIEGGNEPHGMLGFPRRLLEAPVRVSENGPFNLTVDRKFGAIGVVCVYYNIRVGSLQSLTTSLHLATPTADFIAVSRGSLVLGDGEGSSVITVDIIDDIEPEVDEIFIVELTEVDLVQPVNSTFQPSLDGSSTVVEVIINANDGTQGEVVFAPQSSSLSVVESQSNVTLTIERTRGAFGVVSVYCYAQNTVSETGQTGAIRGEDFFFQAKDLVFEAGETTKQITLMILQDNLPEPDERLEVILDSPKDGLVLGEPHKAVVTILANDGASGIVNFLSPENVTVNEPVEGSSDPQSVQLTLVRGPGIFGGVMVQFVVQGPGGRPVVDLVPDKGVVTFQNKQGSAILELTIIPDTEPEEAESFLVILSEPDGGAILGQVVQKMVIIERNDAPYGLLEIYPAGTSNSSLILEEDAGIVYFDIIRNHGDLGRVSVDMVTESDTARSQRGSNITLSLTQEIPERLCTSWYSFYAFGLPYVVLLNREWTGVMTSTVGSTGAAPSERRGQITPSALYRWQGVLVPVQTIETDGATSAEAFSIGSNSYLVITNSGQAGRHTTKSRLYSVGPDGSLTVVQEFSTRGATSASFMSYGSVDYILMTNYQDNRGQTRVKSDLYRWETEIGQFSSLPVRYLDSVGAVAMEVLVLDDRVFVLVASYMDSVTRSYDLKSILYRLDSSRELVVYQQFPTRGAISLASFVTTSDTHLVIANERDNFGDYDQTVDVYSWNTVTQQFVLVQEVPVTHVKHVHVFWMEEMFKFNLVVVSSSAPSEIFEWDTSVLQFEPTWVGPRALDLYPLVVTQPDSDLVMLLQAPDANYLSHLSIHQVAVVSDSDYIPRSVMVTFEPGQSLLRLSVEIVDDTTPEDTERFFVRLNRPRLGAELGPHGAVTVNILSNDNGHGVVGFSEDSLLRYVEETAGKDNLIQINVVRQYGVSGRVVVEWLMSGDNQGLYDLNPIKGTVEFADGESVTTISITIRDDGLPEQDETSIITLTRVLQTGTSLKDRGATIGSLNKAKLIVQANDSPYGVVHWEKSNYVLSEPENVDGIIQLYMIRSQGTAGHIQVSYMTTSAGDEAGTPLALSGADYIAAQGSVDLFEGETQALVEIIVLPDLVPELSEIFLVNITNVQLLEAPSTLQTRPTVRRPGNIAVVTIEENDNARGTVQFNVTRSHEGRVDVFEGIGIVSLDVTRTAAQYGAIDVNWQATPREADIFDFTPSGGVLRFKKGVFSVPIEIYIEDDIVAEHLETFDVKLLSVPSGGAVLGTDTSVRVGIRKSDSPNGIFSFVDKQRSVKESSSLSDPEGVVHVDISRLGTSGVVSVQWRLSPEAADDFVPPLAGNVTFNAGEELKTIRLRTKPDDILEGEETYSLSLISASNNADISPTAGDMTVIIQADTGASGVVRVTDTRVIYMAEPGAATDGSVLVNITRDAGTYGEVVLTWQLVPRDLQAFVQTQGQVMLRNLQQNVSIVIQASDDSIPELSATYTLELIGANGGATINQTRRTARIIMVSSDYPHGLIEFGEESGVTVEEGAGQVTVTIERRHGNNGEVQVYYTTSPGTALSLNSSDPDYHSASGWVLFKKEEIQRTVTITLVDDDLAEGPEYFYVNLTEIQLISPSDNNYTTIDGLQRDMAPAIGPLSILKVTIDKNDQSEGIVQFQEPPLHGFMAYEDDELFKLPVIRQRGAFGKISVQSEASDISAIQGQDYRLPQTSLVFGDSVDLAYINITIENDTLQEFEEKFTVVLTGVEGGATLGTRTMAEITIAKSDFPNGRFGFRAPIEMTVPNPDVLIDVSVTIERSLGHLGQQTLRWRILGPNDANRLLEETTDVSYYDASISRETTSGQLTWADGEVGPQTLALQVRPHAGWEIAKRYIVTIHDIQGFPADSGNGDVGHNSGNLTLTVSKYGFPNGIVHFDGLAQLQRELDEPTQGSTVITFPLVRTEGTIGDIQIYWHVIQPSTPSSDISDIFPSTGRSLIPAGVTTGVIELSIMAEDVPELRETFTVVLLWTEGGADIDRVYNTSTFSIRYNDGPHGEFGILAEYQTVTVQPGTLRRHLQLNITRFSGTFGRVRVNFAMRYNAADTGVSYAPATGTVLFNNAEPYTIVRVQLESQRFLVLNSTFTVTLMEAVFAGDGETTPPVILTEHSAVDVRVPVEAANSQIGFLDKTVSIDEVTNRATITIHRIGAYGSVTLDWLSGFPATSVPDGYNSGVISPISGTLTLPHLTEQVDFTIQVVPDLKRPSLYSLHLPLDPITSAPGGATIRTGHMTCNIEPYGVLRFAEESRQVTVTESDTANVEVVLYVERVFGSLDSIQIRYHTVSDSAIGRLDFRQIDNGAITMDPRQISSSIFIEITKDDIPETDEQFHVELSSIIRLPTGTSLDESPRLSTEFATSTVTIHSSNDPYGVFSVLVEGTGRVTEPSSVNLMVTRTGGTFGQVSVRVRTAGGGEPWDDLIDVASSNNLPDTIGEVLAARNKSRQAVAGQDYQRLDMLLQFEEGATKSSVTLYITDDTIPEDDESLFVYLEALTRGARVARPSTDNGLKGFAELVLEKNDFWNGWLGFNPLNSTSVTADEDSGLPVQLTVERRNASFQHIQFYWRALVEKDVQSVRSDRIDLLEQLVTTTGGAECLSGRRMCHFSVPINNDQIPENSTWFIVEIYLDPLKAEQGAQIDPSRRYANVTILPSDNPNGMVQFAEKSRYLYIDREQDSVAVRVERTGYSGKQVSVSYNTVQLERPIDLASTRVFHALEGADYDKLAGSFMFEVGEIEKTILVSRNPLKASDNPYPKMFNLQLDQVSNGASLGVSLASVTITDKSDVAVWQLWAEAQTELRNDTIDDLMRKLTSAAQSRDLTQLQLDVVTDIMDSVMTTATEQAPLQEGVRTSIMRVFCDLLDPQRQDATRGRWQLSQILDRFALSYTAHLRCATCCQDAFIESPLCQHVQFVVAKRYPEDINNYRWNARNSDSFSVAPGLLRVSDHGRLSPNPKCYPTVLMDYSSDIWFTTQQSPNILLNNKVISLTIQDEASRILNQPMSFRIHTSGQGTPAKRSQCVYYDDQIQQWTSRTQYGRDVCSVKNNLALALDNYVDCACNHLSLYAVKSDLRNPDMIGYPIWFHISCFICMAGLALSILAHHVCIYTRFAASLLMHMCFAVLATEVCYVIDAYLSSYHLLNIAESDNNYRCIVMSLFLHYFFMAQFTWMMAQAINFFKILVLNDEHTERKFLAYILIGWGLPIILVAVFYIATYLIYRFLTDLTPDRIYGDVTHNGDICFVTNPIAGLAGIMAPCLIFLMVIGIVFIQAYQVSPQWQSYDDIYKGRHNIHEVRFILLLNGLIVLTWLWGGLHLAYQQLWMLVLFCIFNITMGVYVFVMYTALRTPCATCMAQQKAVYAINETQGQGTEIQVYPGTDRQFYPRPEKHTPDNIKGSQHALIMHEEPWEKESITLPNDAVHTNNTLRVKRSAPNANIYVVPPMPYTDQKHMPIDQHESQDLNDLILALRAGEVATSSDSFNPLDSRDITTDGSIMSHIERKRIPIADTHL